MNLANWLVRAREFFSMGGYALYVWGSYGVTFLLLGAEVFMLLKRKRDLTRRATSPELETQKPELESVKL
jgi:heme exporter protein D